MLAITTLQRVFTFTDKGQEIRLADPSDTFSPEAVLNFYAQTYPILTTATIVGPKIEDDTIRYTFTAQIGTKG